MRRTITAIITGMLFAASPSAMAGNAIVTPRALALAINKAEGALVPYRVKRLTPGDIRAIHCVSSDEEPTEFQCKWQQRNNGSWVKRTTWLAIDGSGWHVMDA